MSKPLPDALRAPITDLASGKAWLKSLIEADLSFHLEDDPEDCLGGLVALVDIPIVKERVASLYAMEWGPQPGMGKWYCPIGYMLSLDPFDASQQADGCLPGAVEVMRSGDLVLLDCEHTADYEYGSAGRYEVHDMGANGGHVDSYDTPDLALAAHPSLQAEWDNQMAAFRARYV